MSPQVNRDVIVVECLPLACPLRLVQKEILDARLNGYVTDEEGV
jgi:hypothetical protein